jgi:hypothetical protein
MDFKIEKYELGNMSSGGAGSVKDTITDKNEFASGAIGTVVLMLLEKYTKEEVKEFFMPHRILPIVDYLAEKKSNN